MGEHHIHTTIKQIIDKHGTEILADLRLMYILSDYSAFDKLSDQHDIVKAIQSEGYGQLLLDCKANNDPNWQNTIGVFINNFLTAHSQYDAANVVYLCDSIAYGAGLLPENHIRKGNSEAKPVQDNAPIDYASELKKLQNEYIALLNSSIVVPEGRLFKKPSGYFPIDVQNNLYLLEQKILMLGRELGQDFGPWCANERQTVWDEYYYPVGPQRAGLFSVIAVSAVGVIIFVSHLVSFLVAKDAVSDFNNGIAHADSLFQAKDYQAAVDAYKLTGDSYKKLYKQSKFRGVARAGAQKATSSLVYECLNRAQSFYDKKDYYEAQIVLNSLPAGLDYTFDGMLAKKLTAMKTDLSAKCEMLLSVEMDGFVKGISKNKGRPSNVALKRIDYLLRVDPSNYWLNFIKNKSAAK